VPPKGSSAPPVSIKAKDLDKNFGITTLIEPDLFKSYEVEYKTGEGDRGTIIKPMVKFNVIEDGKPVVYKLLAEPTLEASLAINTTGGLTSGGLA
jgi:hypothetical protein